jgi:tRNA A37 threonylcarbamoyladenosine synthetase subunit TsaC/SUA5/YrdC
MAQLFHIHPEHPQPRLIKQAAEIARSGGLIALPTDAAYSLAGVAGYAPLLDRIRSIRGVDERHHFTLMCRDLSEIATYARVDNTQYRQLKATTPGSYTFILEGTARTAAPSVASEAQDHRPAGSQPSAGSGAAGGVERAAMLTSTLILPGFEAPLADPDEIRQHLEKAA